ncbi:hypothetical protein BH18ACI3_BH18ACI3_16030 [soil metagenome]
MKTFFILVCLIVLTISTVGQKPAEILATAAGRSFTSSDLSEDGRKLFENQNTLIAGARTKIFAKWLADLLLGLEAKSKNISMDALLDSEFNKIPDPNAAEIKAVYDANRAALGDKPVEAVRPQIVDFLRRQPEQQAIQNLIEKLKVKYKVVSGKDVKDPNLKPSDSLVAFNGKSISVKEFEEKNKAALYDVRARIADNIKFYLVEVILSALINEEAKAKNTDAASVIAAEITNKLIDFSDAEREAVVSTFQSSLFKKYAVKLLFKEAEPFVQNISTDDDPSQGKLNAPVTVVMFSDFQCSACGAAHPVLKRVLVEYGDKIRLVVRDYPLTTIHENAFQAALAANAANAQGKFFEYIELLYRNQNALDDASLKKYAADLGLNVKQFELDLSSEKTAAEVRKDMADGSGYGIQETPTIFVNGVKVRRLSAEGIKAAIENAQKK